MRVGPATRPPTRRTSGRVGPTSLTASPSVSLAVAVIHTVQDDEGKGEEAKLHLGGRAGERRLSKSGNWRAHPRSRRRARCCGRRGGRAAAGRGPLWSVRRDRHLSALNLRGREEKQRGWRARRDGSCLFASPNLRGEGGGGKPTAWHEPRSSLARAHSCWRCGGEGDLQSVNEQPLPSRRLRPGGKGVVRRLQGKENGLTAPKAQG